LCAIAYSCPDPSQYDFSTPADVRELRDTARNAYLQTKIDCLKPNTMFDKTLAVLPLFSMITIQRQVIFYIFPLIYSSFITPAMFTNIAVEAGNSSQSQSSLLQAANKEAVYIENIEVTNMASARETVVILLENMCKTSNINQRKGIIVTESSNILDDAVTTYTSACFRISITWNKTEMFAFHLNLKTLKTNLNCAHSCAHRQ